MDTYNHKIKVIDPFNNEIFSWLGNGTSGIVDAQTFDASLNEPSGVCSIYDTAAKDIKVFIADCNNHCVRFVHYDQGNVTTPEIKGIPLIGEELEKQLDPLPSQKQLKTTNSTIGTTLKTNDTETIVCENGRCYPKYN